MRVSGRSPARQACAPVDRIPSRAHVLARPDTLRSTHPRASEARHLERLHRLVPCAAADAASPALGAAGPSLSGDAYFAGTDRRPIILFDGVCNLCNGGVNFMLRWDAQGRCRFAALQSPAGRALLRRANRAPTDISSIVLVEEGASHIKSDAILKIAQRLEIPFPLLAGLGLLVPRGLRDVVYDGVANNRYSFFGQSSECRLGDDRFADRFIAD